MGEGGGALEFAEDFFFVVEEVAEEAVGVLFLHCYGGVGAGAEDAGG